MKIEVYIEKKTEYLQKNYDKFLAYLNYFGNTTCNTESTQKIGN